LLSLFGQADLVLDIPFADGLSLVMIFRIPMKPSPLS